MNPPVILVTGAARRVGAAIARHLHASGAVLAIHCRASCAEAERLAGELNAARADSAAVFAADLTDTAALPGLVAAAVARFGRLDGLVNNASSFFPTPVGQIDEEAWADLAGSNLKAPLFLAQAAAPHLAAAGGCIVNITDVHAERPLKGYPVYSAAKGGLLALTRALAIELAPAVRVNAVAPGAIQCRRTTPTSRRTSRRPSSPTPCSSGSVRRTTSPARSASWCSMRPTSPAR